MRTIPIGTIPAALPMDTRLPSTPVLSVTSIHWPLDMSGFMERTANISGCCRRRREYADRDFRCGRPQIAVKIVRCQREIAGDAKATDGEDDAEEEQERLPLDVAHDPEGVDGLTVSAVLDERLALSSIN